MAKTTPASSNVTLTQPQHLFITATDTDAGKTYIAVGLTKSLVKKGFKVAVYKPIAAGCELSQISEDRNAPSQLVNEDALLLQQASNCQQPYQAVNPIAFEEPIAPHIAALKHNTVIDQDKIVAGYHQLNGDINIIEGAGGWRLPLGNGHFLSDIVKNLKPKVILVVNMKLGCLNHAVLTYQSIIADGLNCVGWIANNQENMPYLAENIAELTAILPIPCLATINQHDDLEQATAILLDHLT